MNRCGSRCSPSQLTGPNSLLLFVFNLAVDCRFDHALAMKIFVFALLSLPMSLLGEGGLPSQPYIYVVGKAGVEKTADIVILRFDLVARAPDQVKANDEVQARAAKVFALLNDRKISQNDVIAEESKSEAEFEQTETYPRSRGKLIGYVVTRVFTVKVRDEYGGCRSWLELTRDLPFEGTPVLSDEEFERASEEIASIASDRQPVMV